MYLPYQLLTHFLLLLIPCLLLLCATPSPSPDPYPAIVSLPARPLPQSNRYTARPPPPEISHDLLPYVIISTIDGALHAVERDGGKVKWSLRDGVSPLIGGQIKGKGEDEYIVEPLSGTLYVFEGENSETVRKLPLSVEQLIELSPFTFPHSPSRIFTGSKHTSLMTIDLRTGQQLDCFSALSENVTDNCVCENEQLLDDLENRSRTNSDILFVGRTDYRLVIHSPPSTSVYSASTDTPSSGERRPGLQEISYSTYTPNSFDKPLAEFWSKSNQIPIEEDGEEVHSTRVELGHDGVAVGVETGGDVKWIKDLGSIGIGVYDILLPLTPLSAKPIIVPQPPPRLEALFPLPKNPDQQHFDIHSKSPSTYIGSVPYQLTLPANDSDQTRPPATSNSDKPLLYALSSSSYPLINFAPAAKPGSQANGSFPLSEDLPEKDQLLPYLLDPAINEKTIDPAPESIMEGLRRKEKVGRSWIFWVVGVLVTLVMAGVGIAGFGQRKTIKQTATPPNEKEPLMAEHVQPSSPPKLEPALPVTVKSEVESPGSPENATKPKKKNARRRVRGGKKTDDRSSVGTASPRPNGDKPLPELPRAISTTALQDENDKERLDITGDIIGYGSHGTVVLRGTWGGRPVAVKRLLSDFTRLASQEVKLLQASDDHPNVIRYYCQERRDNFLYIALDLCQATLHDLFLRKLSEPPHELHKLLEPKKALVQVTAGLKHLHDMNIIHRDIKPQNVLVTLAKDGSLKMVVSDFGLARRLETNQSSFAPTANNLGGTTGWRAPECIRGQVRLNEGFERETTLSSSSSSGSLLDTDENDAKKNHARLTKAVDLFALGCLYFWVITGGTHPYGDDWAREGNIVKGDIVNVKLLDNFNEEAEEVKDLIGSLLSLDPAQRPKTAECLIHPYFWTTERRLRFLCDASDRFEIMVDNPPEPTLVALENNATKIVGKDWVARLDKAVASNLKTRRTYKGNSVRDLLRAMRNKKNHYQDLDAAGKKVLGSLPDGFLFYFTSRHPHLFLHVYRVIREAQLGQENMFEGYFAAQE